MNREPVVRLEGVVYRYGPESPPAVDGMTLHIEDGESFGLVGPDGAGKTTLMRLLCGLLEPAEGEIWILGERQPEGRAVIKPRIGYVSQRFSLYGDLTIQENLDFFADIHGVRGKEARERKESLLAFTRLAPFRHRLADRLSGGMRQKLSLICTLVHEPELLLLDEPTTGVDPITRRDFWSILTTLAQQGLTVVMSTPYLDEAERCSRVALVDSGRLLALGDPNQIRRSSGLDILEVVCSPVRQAAELLDSLENINAVHSFGDRLHVVLKGTHAADVIGPRVKALLEGKGVLVRAMRSVVPGLEDVFIDLVGRSRSREGGA